MADRICSVDGCDRKHDAHGYCSMHRQRVRATGSIDLVPRAKSVRICTVEECGRERRSSALYCDMHDQRVKKHGDPHVNNRIGEQHFKWTGDEVRYDALHRRITKTRGRAVDHDCVDCGEQARDWSYNNTGIDERMEGSMRYSTDIQQYSPRCTSCHRLYDKAFQAR